MTDNDRLQKLKLELQETRTNCQRFCFAARAREYQIEAIEQLGKLRSKTTDLKAAMVAVQNEDYANQLLSIEEMINALTHELKMWVAFKDDDPHKAWAHLVEAQSAVHRAIQAHEIAGHLEPYAERLYALEVLLFPPQTFMSVGMIVRRSSCSICGMEYGDCEHIKGKAYMGQHCVKIIDDAEALEASIVAEPANKHCRILSISDENGARDLMTWRIISGDSSQEESMKSII